MTFAHSRTALRENNSPVTHRILGFDLARAYAIMGMYIVNFNIVFGSHEDDSWLGTFLGLFNGNSSTIFVILAGMGVALMSNRASYSVAEKSRVRATLHKRSWFLFFLGLLLYAWWPADILHFYGGYMHVALLLVFLPPRYFVWAAVAAIAIFHLLLWWIPYETGWDFDTLVYTDFWTWNGFLRNTLYNGWNPVFPWLAYFLGGMWLGRQAWHEPAVQKTVLVWSAAIYITAQLLLAYLAAFRWSDEWHLYLFADYLPPSLSFMISTGSFGCMVIALFMMMGARLRETAWVNALAATGQMTLTHYIQHLTVGLVVLGLMSGNTLSGNIPTTTALPAGAILLFALVYFAGSVWFSHYWKKRWLHGPLESMMRKLTG